MSKQTRKRVTESTRGRTTVRKTVTVTKTVKPRKRR